MSNEYKAKVALQKHIINNIDGNDKIKELKRIANQSNIEKQKEKLCSREQILDKKSSRVSKIRSVPMTDGKKEKIGKWNSLTNAYSKANNKKIAKVKENFVSTEKEITKEKDSIVEKFNKLKELVERGGASE